MAERRRRNRRSTRTRRRSTLAVWTNRLAFLTAIVTLLGTLAQAVQNTRAINAMRSDVGDVTTRIGDVETAHVYFHGDVLPHAATSQPKKRQGE